ncbi:MAG: MazG family protein [Planctomycetota bacterium]
MHENKTEKTVEAFKELYAILERLHAPGGCPWDQKQTQRSMAPLILEEAYEATDAIDRRDSEATSEELGDLLMNVLLTCIVADKDDDFDTPEVLNKISAKLIHRHPHVFGDVDFGREEQFLRRWEALKRKERKSKNQDTSAVAGIPSALPGLLRALKFVEKLKRSGAKLPIFGDPVEKAKERLALLPSLDADSTKEAKEDAIGDLFLAQVFWCAAQDINPEMALKSKLNHLEKSFRSVEETLGDRLDKADSEELEKLWKKNAGPFL